MVSFGLYQALMWIEAMNSNVVLRAVTNLHTLEWMEASLSELRGKDIPLLMYRPKQKKHRHRDDEEPPEDAFQTFFYPEPLHHRELRESEYVDFGQIDLKLLSTEDQKRQIYIMVEDLQNDARSLDRERDDDMEMVCCPPLVLSDSVVGVVSLIIAYFFSFCSTG